MAKEVREGFKRCSRGELCVHPDADHGWLPATKEYFGKNKNAPMGLSSPCKKCEAMRGREYAQKHKAEIRERVRNWRHKHPEKTRAQRQRAYWKDPEKARARSRRWHTENPEKAHERAQRWRAANPDKVRNYSSTYNRTHQAERNRYRRIWAVTHPEKARAQKRRYYIKHADYVREKSARWYELNREYAIRRSVTYARIWRANNPEKARATWLRRRGREHSLPNTLTSDDWKRALAYFERCCAYCGRDCTKISGTEADHYIPLSSAECEGTTATNIVPTCRRCNRRKGARHPVKFFVLQFGIVQASYIAQRIEAYFEWAKTQGR